MLKADISHSAFLLEPKQFSSQKFEEQKKTLPTILIIILSNFATLQHRFDSAKIKQNLIPSKTDFMYELPYELPYELRLRMWGNYKMKR